MSKRHLKLETLGIGQHRLTLDGKDISDQVQSMTMTVKGGNIPEVTLALMPFTAEFDTLVAEVSASLPDTQRLNFFIERDATWFPSDNENRAGGSGMLLYNSKTGSRVHVATGSIRTAIDAALLAETS